MKPVWMFVLGAALASGIVYYSVRPDEPRAETPVETVVSPEYGKETPAAEQVQEPAAEEPVTAAAPAAAQPRTQVPARADEPKPAVEPKVVQPKVAQDVAQPEPVSPEPDPVASLPLPVPPPPVAAKAEPLELKPEPRQPRQPQTVTLPAGTLIVVRVDETLSTAYNVPGDSFRATLDEPVIVEGLVIAEKGSRLEGRVVEADRSGRMKGRARLLVELVRLNSTDGQRIRLQTATFAKEAESSKGSDAAKIGAAAGLGAAIGAIAGGGKGAAIGAAAGGAAGAGGIMATPGRTAEIPSETKLSFRLSEPVTVTEKIP